MLNKFEDIFFILIKMMEYEIQTENDDEKDIFMPEKQEGKTVGSDLIG